MAKKAKQACCRIEDINMALSDYASRSVIVYLKEHVPVVIAVGVTKRIERGKPRRAELVCRDIDTELAVTTNRSPNRIVWVCQSGPGDSIQYSVLLTSVWNLRRITWGGTLERRRLIHAAMPDLSSLSQYSEYSTTIKTIYPTQ
jgi:hypothetical protein